MYFIIMKDGRRVERNMFGDPNYVLLEELPEDAIAIEIVPEVATSTPGIPGETRQNWVEQPFVDVSLLCVRDPVKKISVIKEIRQHIGTSLREAKEFVDRAPSILVKQCPRSVAESLKMALENAGATIELLPLNDGLAGLVVKG